MRWRLVLFRLPAEPSRHRVAVWRELRRTGAVTIGQSVWLVPAAPAFDDGVARVVELIGRGGTEPLILDVSGTDEASARRLAGLYVAAREEEWVEFVRDCGSYLAELEKEVATEKFTLAELDEEEQSLDRLRRWYRELRVRDVIGAPSAPAAEAELRTCEASLERFTELVFGAVHAPTGEQDGDG